MKILIGYDGSQNSDAMLRDLHRAGLPATAEVTVVSVADIWLLPYTEINAIAAKESSPTTPPPSIEAEKLAAAAQKHALELLHHAEAVAEQACTKIKTEFPFWQVTPQACAGSPAWEIIKLSDQWQPDLIIVGSHGHSTLGRIWFGSVSQKVVTEAYCSVRVARGEQQIDHRPVKIILGVDGSADANAAVKSVVQRVWPSGSEVRLITSIGASLTESMLGSLPMSDSLSERIRSAIADTEILHQNITTQLQAQGLITSTVLHKDNPKHALLAEAEQWQADSIFLGSRGLGAVKRFLLGSVSTAVVSRAHCSVEIVRSPKPMIKMS